MNFYQRIIPFSFSFGANHIRLFVSLGPSHTQKKKNGLIKIDQTNKLIDNMVIETLLEFLRIIIIIPEKTAFEGVLNVPMNIA